MAATELTAHHVAAAAAAPNVPRVRGTFHLELEQPGKSEEELARSFMSCQRIRKVISTVAHRAHLRDHDVETDLRTEAWMRLWPRLAELDQPENVYRLVWRIAELASKELARAPVRVESMAEVAMDDDATDESDQWAGARYMEERAEALASRASFEDKLARCGWPKGAESPRDYVQIKRPGRPKKSS